MRKYVNRYIKKGYRVNTLIFVNKNSFEITEFNGPQELFDFMVSKDIISKDHNYQSFRSTLCGTIRKKGMPFKQLIFKKDEYSQELAKELLNRRSCLLGIKRPLKEEQRPIDNLTILSILKEPKNMLQKDIATKYGISRVVVNRILIGRNYSDVTGIEYKRRYKTTPNQQKNG